MPRYAGRLKQPTIHRSPPTKIVRRPLPHQLPLSLRPRERLAARRRRKRILGALVFVVFMGAGIAGAGWLSYHERFTLNSVEVRGVAALSPLALEGAFERLLSDNAFHLFSKRNIFLYPRQNVERALLSEFPRLKHVSLSRESLLAQAVVIDVKEREARYRWCNETCFLMDPDGYIFAEDGEYGGYVFRGGLVADLSPIGQWFLRGRLEKVLELFAQLDSLGFKALGATVENETDLQVPLERGFYLRVAFAQEASDVAKNLELVLSSEALREKVSELEYVDLRFGDKVYYQMKQTE